MALDTEVIAQDIEYCERCRCHFCTEYCASYQVSKWLPWSARGRMDISRYLNEGSLIFDENVRDAIYTCQLCRRCSEHCSAVLPNDRKIDVAETMVLMRNEIVTKHPELEPDVFREMCANMKECGAMVATTPKEKTAWVKGLDLREGGERIFFASCMNPLMGYFAMALESAQKYKMSMTGLLKAEKGMRKLKLDKVFRSIADTALKSNEGYVQTLRSSVKILQKLGLEVGYLADEPCCGAALHTYGHLDDFQAHSQKTWATLKQQGVREIIMINPICQGIMASVYPQFVEGWDITCRHLWEVVAEKIQSQDISLESPQERTVTFHDPCYAARYVNQIEPPRVILNNTRNIRFVEAEYHGRFTNCCGGGGAEVKYSELTTKMATNRVKELLETGADTIVTSCPICVVMLKLGVKEAGLKAEVMDIAEFIASGLQISND